MSLSGGLIALVALSYMAVLFAIAFYGDRNRESMSPRIRAWVYSLSLAVYCTSWTFFGAVGQAAEQLWSFLPIYLGPILLLLLAPQVLQKMILISKQENITSIADFIAARYGKSQVLAIVVTLICLVGVLPYIALQLKGIVLGVNLLIGSNDVTEAGSGTQDTALIVSIALALFTILFGTRNLDVTEHHRGMVLAIAFESLIKLLAFIAVGLFVTFGLYNGFGDLFNQAHDSAELSDYWAETINWPAMLVQTTVAMMAIVCLPRQFHVTVVENIDPRDFRLARWVFPLYLLLAALFVVPIALAGQMLLPDGIGSDSFVISVPLAESHPALAMLAFIGGASAATGMVIVASVALSTMVSNDMLLPWLLRRQEAEQPFEAFRHWMLSVRRITIIMILLLAYVSYRLLGSTASLATIGQIAFAALTQLAPAMVGALYWKQANRRGVFAGLTAGSLIWLYTLILPLLGWPLEMFPGLQWMYTTDLPFNTSALTLGVMLSLLGNATLFFWVSILSQTRVAEHWQASRFIGQEIASPTGSRRLLAVQVEDLLMLASRFVGAERAELSFQRFARHHGQEFSPRQPADGQWIAHTERLLAGVLGASSTRAVVKAALEGRDMQVEDVVRIVGEASEVLQFNRALLQGAIENITQGISVVDQSLRLVAWNHRYLEMFDYPDGLVYIGRPIADIIRYNAERGLCGPGDADTHVTKRLYWMRQGRAHTSERTFPNGRVVELIGNPMPGGGFVMSFSDITAFREAERALKDANEGLEQRVSERTQELSLLNQALTDAKSTAEAANQSKTRFLAAVSHDLSLQRRTRAVRPGRCRYPRHQASLLDAPGPCAYLRADLPQWPGGGADRQPDARWRLRHELQRYHRLPRGRAGAEGRQRGPGTTRQRTDPGTVAAQPGLDRRQEHRRGGQPVEDAFPRRGQPRPDAAAERRAPVLRRPVPSARRPAARGAGTGASPGQFAALGRGPDLRPAGHFAPGKRPYHPRSQRLRTVEPVRHAGRRVHRAGRQAGH